MNTIMNTTTITTRAMIMGMGMITIMASTITASTRVAMITRIRLERSGPAIWRPAM